MRSLLCLVLALVVHGAMPAQGYLRGNGIPSAYVENSPGMLGGNLVVGFGSPTTPNGFSTVNISTGITPFLYPFPEIGMPIALDPFAPGFEVFLFGLDAQGHGGVTVPLPPAFLPATAGPLFVVAVAFESAAQWSVTRTSRIDWMVPDSWEPAAPLAVARQLHSATALGAGPRDNVSEVLICGGATGSFVVPTPLDSAELFSPVTRSTTPLPAMSLPRSLHRAVRLPDGRVLVTGGVTTGGAVTATCEFFDALTLLWTPAPAMSSPRSGHAMTLLPDGRVLVSGGVANWQNTATNLIGALNTSQATAEIFDPATSAWSPLPNMASRRLGHTQTVLQDGRVLIVSGIFGGYGGSQPSQGPGQIPQYTTSCEIFDPSTNTFTPTGALVRIMPLAGNYNGRAFHGASLLPNGDVLVTGGLAAKPPGFGNDETVVTGFTDIWQAASGAWVPGANLPVGMAFHGHEPHGAGAIVCGGFSGDLTTLATTPNVYRLDATTITPLAPIPGGGRGAHSLTRLCDGTFLVYGGGVWPNTVGDGWIYAPN
jgi:hypothetical protein